MILTILIGFLLGLSVPAIASRFGKILPADPGLICAQLWHKPRFPKSPSAHRTRKFYSKWRRLILRSVLWGMVLAVFYGVTYVYVDPKMVVYACVFLYMVALLMTVDHQFYLLPDFFTIPLLLLGITVAYVVPQAHLSFADKLVGAWFGYLLSTVSVFIMSFFKKGEFGAGDVKMLTALGAWFGAIFLNCILVMSFVFFYICVMRKKRRSDAFGPALGAASIIMFFYVYTNLF